MVVLAHFDLEIILDLIYFVHSAILLYHLSNRMPIQVTAKPKLFDLSIDVIEHQVLLDLVVLFPLGP